MSGPSATDASDNDPEPWCDCVEEDLGQAWPDDMDGLPGPWPDEPAKKCTTKSLAFASGLSVNMPDTMSKNACHKWCSVAGGPQALTNLLGGCCDFDACGLLSHKAVICGLHSLSQDADWHVISAARQKPLSKREGRAQHPENVLARLRGVGRCICASFKKHQTGPCHRLPVTIQGLAGLCGRVAGNPLSHTWPNCKTLDC